MWDERNTLSISRRNLLKGAGAGALVLGLSGCSSGSASGSNMGSSTTVAVSVTENEAEAVSCTSDQIGLSLEDMQSWAKDTVYDVDAQAAIAEDLASQKDGQTLAQPLVAYNPFGTNSQSLYVYFTTDEVATVEYTVSVSDEEAAGIEDESFTADSIADFTRSVNGGESATEFEFSLYGLVPNVENIVTITATYEGGDVEATTFACDMCDVLGTEELQLDVTDGESDAGLEDGLYTVIGNTEPDSPVFTSFYDNDGILRGELPLYSYRSDRLAFQDDLMYFCYSYSDLAAMNELGQVVNTYTLTKGSDDGTNYSMHHDYVFDDSGHLMVLATDKEADTEEDLILFLNVETGEIDHVLDMGDLMAGYKEQAVAYNLENDEDASEDGHQVDWIHINTIQWAGDDSIILSCREISSIIKVSDVYDSPSIAYIISSKEYWEGTEYEDLVYEQVGDFTVQGGQHTVTYVEDDSLDDGQYYLYMYDNHIGTSAYTTSDFDYSVLGLSDHGWWTDEEGVYSYYYKYLVDENEGTFELVSSIEVPYSGYVSSAQELETNVIVCSGKVTSETAEFGAYDEDGDLIRSYTMGVTNWIYRVFKYDL